MLNDLGTALDSQGQFSEAEKSVMESLDVAKLNKDVAGIEEYLAIIQCNLAEILDHQGTFIKRGGGGGGGVGRERERESTIINYVHL